MISQSFRQVVLDVKVGPPSFEKGLAEDILSLLRRTNCKNCLVWAKSDDIGREIIKLSKDVIVHCSLFFISLFELSICYLYLGPLLLHSLTGVSYAVGWLCCHGG
ncbi:Glycerophosphodiester phosphodiesterase GDPD4 [Zea mays]|nr:Glycerophosphodiester phosphodiesterase GDPD4 [Zea mays]